MPQHQLELKTKVLELLDEHRFMTVATLRDDGWPQATMVGYVHEDLTLYFAVAHTSQKLANIQRDDRVSIALGHEAPTRLCGLSMAARAEPVTDLAEVDSVNALLRDRYQGRVAFSPRETASRLVRAAPLLISIIDLGKGPGEPVMISVADGEVKRVRSRSPKGGAHDVLVQKVRPHPGPYRPGAPP
ncbi:MAG TPA: pyridoxamine 5'-phosphate oxidase family protein [Caulobacteraceae bacterium]|nr:pyridoxamine 5'-phosphate oxidase family protein [Caulobacteraceae bacterium]